VAALEDLHELRERFDVRRRGAHEAAHAVLASLAPSGPVKLEVYGAHAA
jgi:hypothetical protein